MAHGDAFAQLAVLGQQIIQHRFVTNQDELNGGVALGNAKQRRDHDAGPGIAAHCIYRNDQFARHGRPFLA